MHVSEDRWLAQQIGEEIMVFPDLPGTLANLSFPGLSPPPPSLHLWDELESKWNSSQADKVHLGGPVPRWREKDLQEHLGSRESENCKDSFAASPSCLQNANLLLQGSEEGAPESSPWFATGIGFRPKHWILLEGCLLLEKLKEGELPHFSPGTPFLGAPSSRAV